MEERTIDAKGETLGRLAVRVAKSLQAKDSASYAPNKVGNKVVVLNADKVKISGRKADQKIYYRQSKKPGHLKKTTYRDAFGKNPEWVIRHAVSGMLPKNRLRDQRLKLLHFK